MIWIITVILYSLYKIKISWSSTGTVPIFKYFRLFGVEIRPETEPELNNVVRLPKAGVNFKNWRAGALFPLSAAPWVVDRDHSARAAHCWRRYSAAPDYSAKRRFRCAASSHPCCCYYYCCSAALDRCARPALFRWFGGRCRWRYCDPGLGRPVRSPVCGLGSPPPAG